MLLRIALCLVGLPIVALHADDDVPRPVRLRVLSYNIHHGEGVDGRLNLPRIAGVIAAADPDIVALQEVDRMVRRTGGVDQAVELARLTGMQPVFGGNVSLQGGAYGNAVLTRLKITHSRNRRLPRRNDGEQRGVLEVRLRWPTRQESLRLLVTHLDYRTDDGERQASADVINQLVETDADMPALLAGDLNDVPESTTLNTLQQKWVSASREQQPTIPVRNPQRQIDYILFRPASRWRVVESQVLPESVASDHRPILAVLELQPSPSSDDVSPESAGEPAGQ